MLLNRKEGGSSQADQAYQQIIGQNSSALVHNRAGGHASKSRDSEKDDF